MKEYISRLNPFQKESGVLHGKPKWKQYIYWFAVLLTGLVMGIYWGNLSLSLWGLSAPDTETARITADNLAFIALIMYFAAAGHKLRELVIRE